MIIDSVIEYNVNFSKYNPLAGSSYIKLLKELDHPRKGLINDQNTNDKECFIWCLVGYLHPADRSQASITKADKDFWKRLDFKHKKFPVKARDIHKTKKKKRIPSALVLLVMKMRKNIQSMYQKNAVKRNLLIYYWYEEKTKDIMFSSKTYHTLNRGRKHFCRYCLQAFSTEEILIYHIKDCFRTNGKKGL